MKVPLQPTPDQVPLNNYFTIEYSKNPCPSILGQGF